MSHQRLDAVSLEIARRVAGRLRECPGQVQIARDNLVRWSRQNAGTPSLLACYAEWDRLLSLPLEEMLACLCAETADGQRLRQNSPFAGVLTPSEIWAIKARHNAHAETPA